MKPALSTRDARALCGGAGALLGAFSGALSGALLVVCTLFAGAAWADPPGRAGRLSWQAGEVTLRDTADAPAAPAQRNWPLTTGNVLATGTAGRAEVWVGASALRLDVDTELQFTQVDQDQLRLRLVRGSLALRSATPEALRNTSVETSLGRFTPVEPGEFRVDSWADPSRFSNGGQSSGQASAQSSTPLGAEAWRGAVLFEGGRSTLTVRSGQRAEFSPAPGGVAFSLAPPHADDFQVFVQNRDAAFDGRNATRYVSPEMTGIEDLDSAGRWQPTAEYGVVWLPTVDAAWAPYRYGRWAWVEPWGWTWIDDAPWGFAPFHYGRWALWHEHWAWVPGGYVARPVYAPALVGWSVGVGTGSAAAWFPLAPHEAYVPAYAASLSYVHQVNRGHVVEAEASARIVAPQHYSFQDDQRATTVVRSLLPQTRPPPAARVVPALHAAHREAWHGERREPRHEAPREERFEREAPWPGLGRSRSSHE